MAKHTTRKSSRLQPQQRLTSPPPLHGRPVPPPPAAPAAPKPNPKQQPPANSNLHQALPQSSPTKPATPNTLVLIVDTKPHEKTFTLNAPLITAHSTLLRKASLEAPSADLAIALPGIRAQDFEAYVIYYGALSHRLSDLAEAQWEDIKPKNSGELSEAQKVHVRVATLLGFWVAGDVLQDVEFKNAVMDAVLEEDLSGEAGAAVVQSAGVILSKTRGVESGLGRLLLDVMAAMVTEDFIEEWSGKWSKEFTVGILKRVVAIRGRQEVEEVPTARDRLCYYEVEEEIVDRLVDALE